MRFFISPGFDALQISILLAKMSRLQTFKNISFNDFFYLIATYGARVRGSVFKMKLRVLAR